MEWEAPRQPIFPLIESSLLMTATLYGVRGMSRREAVRPIREDGKGGGARITMPGCSYCNDNEVTCVKTILWR